MPLRSLNREQSCVPAWLLIPIVGMVYALDQLTKFWVEEGLCHARSIPAEGTDGHI